MQDGTPEIITWKTHETVRIYENTYQDNSVRHYLTLHIK